MRIVRIIPRTLIFIFTSSLLCTAETVTTPLQQYGLRNLVAVAFSPDGPKVLTGGLNDKCATNEHWIVDIVI